MRKLTGSVPMTNTDKICLIALAGVFLTANLIVWAMDTAAYRAAEADKPASEAVTLPEIDYVPLFEAAEAVEIVEAAEPDPYDESIPLDRELQTVLREVCEAEGVPLHIALGLIEVESNFDPEEDNGVSYGLMQLNRRYYPDDLTPAENIRAGVAHLAGQLERYGGDVQAALRGYNRGYDDGDRQYAKKVLDAAEKWRNIS